MDEGLRAEAIFHRLKVLRTYCVTFPDYNVAVNLNGMNGCVDVKVFKDNQCVHTQLDPEDALAEMLGVAVDYLYTACGPLPKKPFNPSASIHPPLPSGNDTRNVNWNEYATCTRCHAVMGQSCRRLDVPELERTRPHTGRVRFQGNGVKAGARVHY